MHALFAVIVAALGLFADAPPEQEVSEQRLRAAVEALPTKRSPGPTPEHREGLLTAQADLVFALKGMGYEPVLTEIVWAQRPRPAASGQEPPSAGLIPYRNIVVEIPGREAPNEVYIFGAHFDAVPDSPGADDNASGVAALLEMARVLKDRPMRRTIRLVFFNLEEVGLIGSRQYVTQIEPDVTSGAVKILGMASLDMLGFYSDEPYSQRWPELQLPNLELPTTGNFLAVAGLMSGRGFSQPLIKAMRGADGSLDVFEGDILPLPVRDFLRSDHAPFLTLGVPAVMITDTANFRSPHYHKDTDTIATLDFKRLTAAARQLAGAAWRLGGPIDQRENVAPVVVPAPPKPVQPDLAPGTVPPAPGRGPETPRGLPPGGDEE